MKQARVDRLSQPSFLDWDNRATIKTNLKFNFDRALSQSVRLAVFFREPLGRFGVVHDGFRFGIPVNLLAGAHRNVAEMTDGRAAVSDTDVGTGFSRVLTQVRKSLT